MALRRRFLEELKDFIPTQTCHLAYYRRHELMCSLALADGHFRSSLQQSPAAEEPVITSVLKRPLSAGDKDDEGGKCLCGSSRLRRCGALSSGSDTDTEADPVPSGPATGEYDFDLVLSATGTDPEPSSAVGVSEPETAAGPTDESSSSDKLPNLILSATGTDPEPSSDGVGVSEPETAAGPTDESSSSDELPDVYAPLRPYYPLRLQSCRTGTWTALELSIVDYMAAQGVAPNVRAIRHFQADHPRMMFTRPLNAVALRLREVAAARQ